MNEDQLMGAVRTIMSAIGGYVMGRGWLTSDQVTLAGGIATALIPLLWSYASHTDRAKVAAAQAVDKAQVAVTDPALASPGVTVGNPLSKTILVPTPGSSPTVR